MCNDKDNIRISNHSKHGKQSGITSCSWREKGKKKPDLIFLIISCLKNTSWVVVDLSIFYFSTKKWFFLLAGSTRWNALLCKGSAFIESQNPLLMPPLGSFFVPQRVAQLSASRSEQGNEEKEESKISHQKKLATSARTIHWDFQWTILQKF